MQPADNDNNNNSRLRPQLNLFDAIATGLAAILGAGIFSVIACGRYSSEASIHLFTGVYSFYVCCF